MDAGSLDRLAYTGPAPVTIQDFNQQVIAQRLTNEVIRLDRVRNAIGDRTFEDRIIEACGPALNSGRGLLLYGPPGNGKTSVARCFASVFSDVIYVPYAVMVDGQIIRVYDPSIHVPLRTAITGTDLDLSLVRRDDYDAR
jgi:MoxR-like ATPase